MSLQVDIGQGAFCAIVILTVGAVWIGFAKYVAPLLAGVKPKERP